MISFQTNIVNVFGNRGKAWLDSLPTLTLEIAKEWELSDLKPVRNLSYNYVLSGLKDNKPVILKLGLDIKKEIAALQAFAGFGTVLILDQREGAILLEHATPGTSLKAYFPSRDKDAIKIICNAMKRLHKVPLPQDFPHIKDWLDILDKKWMIPEHYLQKARNLREQLLKTSSKPVLLHGDLHHDNCVTTTIISRNDNYNYRKIGA